MSATSERIIAQTMPYKDRSAGGPSLELYSSFFEALRIRLRNSRSAEQLARTSHPRLEEPWDRPFVDG